MTTTRNTINRVILCTANAKYIHTSFGLRYLLANLEEFQEMTSILEFTINERPIEIAESILKHAPDVVGLSVYLWNVELLSQVVDILKDVYIYSIDKGFKIID